MLIPIKIKAPPATSTGEIKRKGKKDHGSVCACMWINSLFARLFLKCLINQLKKEPIHLKQARREAKNEITALAEKNAAFVPSNFNLPWVPIPSLPYVGMYFTGSFFLI